MRILIAEDDEDLRLYLQKALQANGHEVEAAEDGLAALKAAYDATPDIIISDILMPRMDGYLLCRNIKGVESLKDIPFIFYTATYLDPKDKELGLSMGAARFLEKPMELSELLTIIEDVKEEVVSGQLTGLDATKKSEHEIDRDYQQAVTRKLEKKVAELEEMYEVSKLNQEILRQSEEKFRDFAAAASDWFWEMNADLRYTYLSDRFETITEFKIADSVGTRCWDYADPQDESGKWANHKADLEAKRPFRDFEYVAVFGAEKQFYLSSSGVPVFDSDDEFIGYRGSTTDITERKQQQEKLRESETRFKQLAEGIDDVFAISDAKNKSVLYASPAYEQIWGRPVQDLYEDHRRWDEGVHPDDRLRIQESWKRMVEQGEHYEEEYRVIHPDGSMRWVRSRGYSVRDESGQIYRVAEIVQNITERKRAEEKLQKAHNELELRVEERTIELRKSKDLAESASAIAKTTLENMGQGILMVDGQHNLLVYNDSLLEYINVTREQAVRCQTFEEFVQLGYHPSEEGVKQSLDLTHTEGYAAYESTLPNGKILEVRQIPLADGGFVRTYTDITKLKAARESFRSLLESAPDAILIVNRDGVIQLVNKQAAKLFEWDQEELVGKPIEVLLPEQFQAHHPELLSGYFKAPTLRPMGQGLELYGVTKSGREIPVDINLSPIEMDEGIVVAAGVRDITVHKEAQEQLQSAKEVAEQATTAKANFLAAMSHEIRTPMYGVIGMVDLLRQTELDSEQEQMLQTIIGSGQSLLTIINDILDFSKIEAGKLDLESIPLSLTDVVEGSAQTIAANATKKGLRLITYVDPELPQFVTGDPMRVRQILINLGGNAIKFTEDGDVVIRAERVGDDEDDKVNIRFSVIDQGIGISEEGQAKLFQAFSQAESSTTRKFGGTGLGLTICKRLSEMMGGEIGVKSQLGEGSEFYAILPFSRSDKRVLEDKVRNLGGLRILLISSHPSEEAILRHYLEYWHAEVISSDELGTCLEQCMAAKGEDKPYDIVVIGPQWSREKQFAVRAKVTIQSTLSDTRFICLLKGKRRRGRLDLPDSVCLDVDPLCRAAFLSAVAVAVGRASPEVYYKEEVEDLKATVKAPTVDEALAQGTLILVAEDNPTNRDVIGRQLKLLGYACEMAEDGKLALEAWRHKHYGILLTDCHMPNMDGFELTDAIRKDEKDIETRAPIVAITANALQGEAERCLAAGMDDYLSKPIDMKELREKLRKWMPQAQTEAVQPEIPVAETVTPVTIPVVSDDSNDPIDERALKNMFGDDPEMFKEILNDFIEPSRQIVKELQAGWEKRCAEDIKQAAHKLKSSARSIGANELADLCLALEAAGIKEDWNTIDNDVSKFDALMADVETYIRAL